MRDQTSIKKIDDFAGLDGHLAVSLAYGLDGKPRDFREVYTILERYKYYDNLKNKKMSKEQAREQAKEEAWDRVIRTFKGTDGKTKGACNTTTIIYREGNIETWNLISENNKTMLTFNIGKFDPSSDRHIMALMQLGIIDEDLKELGIT